jgi:stage V sporulation protein B
MIYSLYLTNKKGYGDSANALCMAAYQIYAMFLTISSIGIPNAISKITAENQSLGNYNNCKRILRIAIGVFSSIGFLTSLILYFGADFIAKKILGISAASDILKILSPSIVFVSIASVLRGYFIGKEKIKISAKIQILEQVVKTIITVVIVEFISKYTNYNTDIMAKGSMLASSITTIFSFIYTLKEYFKIEKSEKYLRVSRIKEVNQSIKSILKEIFEIAIPLSITSFLTILESNIDSVTIVRLLKNKIGENNAREKFGIITSKVNLLVSLPMTLNGAVAVALIPEISKANVMYDKLKLEQSVNFSFLITLFISVPFMLGLFVYSNDIINFLYPNANKGGELLKLGTLTIVFTSLSQTMSGILQGMGDSKVHLKAISIAMVLKLMLNFVFIPIPALLEKGAILSSCISDFLIFMIMYIRLREKLELKINLLKNSINIFILSLCAVLISKLIASKIILNFYLKFIIEILLVVIIYIILSIKTKIIDIKKASKYLKFSKKQEI